MKLDRRGFVLTAASLAAWPWVRRTAIPAANAADLSLLIHANMDMNDFRDYESYGDSSIFRLGTSGNSPTISTDRARVGVKSARIYLNRRGPGSTFRTEATTSGTHSRLEFRRTYWIGFSIYVPSDWAVSSTQEVLFQLHHVPPRWGEQPNFSPILALRCMGESDRWCIQQDYVQAPEDQARQSDLRSAFIKQYGKIEKGQWTDWVFEYRPDWRSLDDGGIGVTGAWCNGSKIVDYTGPNCVNNTTGPYIKFGCYKSAWKDAGKFDKVSERLYYFDEFRVSRPDQGSYEAVAPGGLLKAKPMAPESLEVS